LCKSIESLRGSKIGYLKNVKVESQSKFKPRKGDSITLHFTGKLPCGVVFEDTRKIDQTLEIKVGRKSLIRGLDEGLLTMSLGERCEFLIRPDWAYADKDWQSNAPPRIPTHLPLIFDVTLLKIANKASDEWNAIQKKKDTSTTTAPTVPSPTPATDSK